jgi:membrane-associated phospholipid phosphatase
MTAILDHGIEVIVGLQQFSPALDGLFRCLTFLGDKEFFLLILPFVYWCVDRRIGARLTLFFLLSACINAAAKAWCDQPRPFEYSGRVRALVAAGGGGLPSGHTQATALVWGYLAVCFRRAWLWGLAALLMLAVPLSRLYLGVHFPTDLLGGYLLGGLLLLLAVYAAPPIERWLCARGWIWQLAAAIGLPGLLLIVSDDKASVTSLAGWMGFASGLVGERRWIGFDSNGGSQRRALRFLLGGAVLLVVWAGLRWAFAAWEPEMLFRFIRYLLVGLWAGLGAPWAFVRLGLAERRTMPQQS